jgi:hypothetical protein
VQKANPTSSLVTYESMLNWGVKTAANITWPVTSMSTIPCRKVAVHMGTIHSLTRLMMSVRKGFGLSLRVRVWIETELLQNRWSGFSINPNHQPRHAQMIIFEPILIGWILSIVSNSSGQSLQIRVWVRTKPFPNWLSWWSVHLNSQFGHGSMKIP